MRPAIFYYCLAQTRTTDQHRPAQQALNGKAHASAACCSLFRAVRDARDLAKQLRRLPVSVMLGAQN